jgi:hypothetical protein
MNWEPGTQRAFALRMAILKKTSTEAVVRFCETLALKFLLLSSCHFVLLPYRYQKSIVFIYHDALCRPVMARCFGLLEPILLARRLALCGLLTGHASYCVGMVFLESGITDLVAVSTLH